MFSAITPLDDLDLSNALATSPDGNPTDSPAGKLLLSALARDPSKASQAVRQKNILALASGEAAIPAKQQVITNPAWVHYLTHNPDGTVRNASATFFPNDGHAAMVVVLKGNLTIEQESAAALSVQNIVSSANFANATTLTTGVPALLRTINNYLKGGMLTLGAIAAVVMIIILLLLFNVRWRLLPFLIVVIGLIWGFGLAGFLGIPLTLASIAGLPVLLGVGIDYAIQMHSRVEEEVILARAPHPIQATARNLGPALLVVTFDAVFAFAALLLAKVPMLRQFGWLLIVGIIAVCICSIIAPLAFLGIREFQVADQGGRLLPWPPGQAHRLVGQRSGQSRHPLRRGCHRDPHRWAGGGRPHPTADRPAAMDRPGFTDGEGRQCLEGGDRDRQRGGRRHPHRQPLERPVGGLRVVLFQ